MQQLDAFLVILLAQCELAFAIEMVPVQIEGDRALAGLPFWFGIRLLAVTALTERGDEEGHAGQHKCVPDQL